MPKNPLDDIEVFHYLTPKNRQALEAIDEQIAKITEDHRRALTQALEPLFRAKTAILSVSPVRAVVPKDRAPLVRKNLRGLSIDFICIDQLEDEEEAPRLPLPRPRLFPRSS